MEEKRTFQNVELESAVKWALTITGTEDSAKAIMAEINPPKILSMCAEALFVAGFNPMFGNSSVIRKALIHLNKKGKLPE